MKSFFVDLHIHIGRTFHGQAVKITASRNLTLSNIIEEASEKKGLDMIGIIDFHSPGVLEEVEQLMEQGVVQALEGGGLRYKNTTVLPGCEVEMRFEELRCAAHFLTYFPTVERMKNFSRWLATKVKNIHLSTQRMYASMQELQEVVEKEQGVMIPAHVFTPFKSVYGNCANSMEGLLDTSKIPAIELGLSSDSEMADHLSELYDKTFVTNSDAHSLAKIGREYQKMWLEECNFAELKQALWRQNDRKVLANYGLQPKLGKYHYTRCAACDELIREESQQRCPYCGHTSLIKGVFNRLREIADLKDPIHPPHRPPYVYQVPLEFIPNLGPKKIQALLARYQTEMKILHEVSEEDLSEVVGKDIARTIILNREGNISFVEGGGGKYGKIIAH